MLGPEADLPGARIVEDIAFLIIVFWAAKKCYFSFLDALSSKNYEALLCFIVGIGCAITVIFYGRAIRGEYVFASLVAGCYTLYKGCTLVADAETGACKANMPQECTIQPCPSCGQRLRFPADKKLIVSCPVCKDRFHTEPQ